VSPRDSCEACYNFQTGIIVMAITSIGNLPPAAALCHLVIS